MFHNDKSVYLDVNLSNYFELSFIMGDVANLYRNLGGYFELSGIMVEVDKLDAKLVGYFMYFHNGRGG